MKSVSIFAGLLLLGGTGFGAEVNPANPWYVEEHTRLVDLLKEKKAAVEKATAALAQARSAEALAQRLNDNAALPIAWHWPSRPSMPPIRA
jgi:hypothetical protein